MLDTLLDYVIKEWHVIREAPGAFFLCVLLAALIIFFVLEWFHSEKMDTLEQRVGFLTERLDESRQSLKTTADALATTQAVEEQTSLRLMFRANQDPLELGKENIRRWYSHKNVAREATTGQMQVFAWYMFITFEKSTDTSYRRVSSPNHPELRFDVLELTDRSMVIGLTGVEPSDGSIVEILISKKPI